MRMNLFHIQLYSLLSHSLVAINQQTGGTDSQHDINTLRVLGGVQIYAIHGQLLGVLQVMQLSLSGRLTSARDRGKI